MIILADKPTGITSFDVIRVLRRVLKIKKIGHSGTLDPMATGALILGTGPDTKKLADLQKLSKTYITTIDFSKMSDTRDLDFRKKFEEYELLKGCHTEPVEGGTEFNIGITKNNKEIPAPTIEELETILKTLIPIKELPLTPFSAKKKDGKKLYELAREGNLINETREMKVNSFKILEYNFPELKLELDVGSGTYIRSIGYRLGQQFDLGGILTSLRRTKVGDFDLNSVEKFETAIGYFDDKEFAILYSEVLGL